MKCSCGKDARHIHFVDGKELPACDNCHVAIELFKANPSGFDVPFACYRMISDGEAGHQTAFDRAANQEPFRYETAASTPTPPPPPPSKPKKAAVLPSHAEGGVTPYFLPVRPNHSEIRRVPPQVTDAS